MTRLALVIVAGAIACASPASASPRTYDILQMTKIRLGQCNGAILAKAPSINAFRYGVLFARDGSKAYLTRALGSYNPSADPALNLANFLALRQYRSALSPLDFKGLSGYSVKALDAAKYTRVVLSAATSLGRMTYSLLFPKSGRGKAYVERARAGERMVAPVEY
jgi:hypothetical protein